MKDRVRVAVLGATGSVGQRFVQLLEGHPWFELVALTGSERREGQEYGTTCRWVLAEEMPREAAGMKVLATDPEVLREQGVELVFSALPSDIAKVEEPRFAQAGIGVCTNAGAFRREADVPILLPEINADHARVVEVQRKNRGWDGFIVTNPNCTSTGMTIALRALLDSFGVDKVFAVSLQATSGAGYPGVPSLDIVDNVIPGIAGEEGKVEWEPRKMLGKRTSNGFELADFQISAHTNRVPVIDGHVVCLSVGLRKKADVSEVEKALTDYQAPGECDGLPSMPQPVIVVRHEGDRPQPRLDRMTGKGMATVVGRVREDPIFDVRFVVLSHNTIRGAAGGSLLNAELLVKLGFVGK